MAAYAALLSVKFILNQIQQHPRPPISLDQQQLLSLTQNLSFLQNFLESYSNEEDELESRIRDAAYAAEDVIESHIVDQIHAGSTCHDENISCVDFYQGLERVIQDMDSIKEEVMDMGLQHHQLMNTTNSSVSIGPVRPVSRMQNNTMVDFGDILIDVMDKLTRRDCDLEIVPIVGMGGSGKSTLATNIYTNPLIVQHFDFLAWVTVSEEHSVREIFLRVLSKENKRGEDHEIGEKVHKKLYGRRYLIVMDDIWSIEAWDKVKVYFPNNSNGSKILITTRNSNLAFHLSGSHDFQMKFLDDDKSWDLLCKIVFGEEGCPIELENIGKRIARNCKGLPLSIVVVGGLLKKSNMTHEYWESTLQNLNPEINLENNEHCLQILGRSYKELPMHLKPCFLYMGVFPEDYRIQMSYLVKLWVAEGFLKPIENKSSEEVAKEYVKELIERNLIIVHDLKWNGKVASCIIHDLLRDLCLREARKQRFLCILRLQDPNIPEDINTVRRICIHHKKYGDYPPQVIHAIESAPLTRSLILVNHKDNNLPLPSSTCRLLRVYFCLRYKENRNCTRSNGDIRALSQQANLRYLSLRQNWYPDYTYSTATISWNLQTLEVYNFSGEIEFAPSEFWKMCYLRHVYFESFQLPDPPYGEDHEFVLENLQTLSITSNFKCSEEMVKRIPSIKKLEVLYDCPINNLCHLRNLTSLHLACTFPNTFPDSLKKLCLWRASIPWEDITSKIGSLPLLESLILNESCVGPEWETIEGQFHSLKFLRIQRSDLKCWMTDNTHFPRLERLGLWDLFKLEEIPLSIGDIPTLQSIKVEHCSKSVVASAERIKEEQLSYGNEDLLVLIGNEDSEDYDEL